MVHQKNKQTVNQGLSVEQKLVMANFVGILLKGEHSYIDCKLYNRTLALHIHLSSINCIGVS